MAEVINNGRKKEEGRRKKEEGRRKKEEGRRKKEEGRRKKQNRNHFGGCCNMNLD
ncbi:hypothetical protein NDI43_17160 [Microcoleus vaginatus GB2-A3]|uniref:hypothetical protein n=1 Tax=Microcoleus vaginatus TaxID=119532 RepID=UPI0032AA9E34